MNRDDIKFSASKHHNDNPYHNWPHGKHVGDAMAILEDTRRLTPGIVWWYFHDADHHWVADSPNDEERAAQIMHDSLVSRGFDNGFIESTKIHIMWTVFSQRWNLDFPKQKLIADADISSIWADYEYYLDCAARLLLETETWNISDKDILIFFWETQNNFFKHLTWITGDSDTPFLTSRAQEVFPNFTKNRDRIQKDVETNKNILIQLVRKLEKSQSVKTFRERFDS